MTENSLDPLAAPRHDESAFADILAGSAAQIEEILGGRSHPDVAAVIRVVHFALSVQRRQLARKLRVLSRDIDCGDAPGPPGAKAGYTDALRRAARIVEGGQR